MLGPSLTLSRDPAFAGSLVLADFTLSDGRLAGFEVDEASNCLPREVLAAAERTDGWNVVRRYQERIERAFDGKLRRPEGELYNLFACPLEELPPITDEEHRDVLVVDLDDFLAGDFDDGGGSR